MGLIQSTAVVALIAGAYISNPDEESFQRYLDKQLKRDGSHWLERKVAAFISANSCRREDYYVFSLMRIPVERVTYLGIFGNWFLLPSSIVPPPQRES